MSAERRARGLAAACLFFVALLPAAASAADGPEDTLRTLYRIALSADMCGFPIATRQSEALGRAIDHALAETGLDDEAAEALYRDVDTSLEAEGWDRVCAADGSWARGWRALLAANAR